MQDIPEPKTFDSPTPFFHFEPPTWKRIQLGGKLLAGALALGATLLWLPRRPHLYFDLGVAVLAIMCIVFVARFSLRQNIERPHAEMGSLMHGVGAAGAICGVLSVALTGESVGVDEILRLTVGFSVAAVLGAAWVLLAGILVYWPVHVVAHNMLHLRYRHEAVAIGTVAGALAFAPLLAMGRFFGTVVAAIVLCAVCTHRAAAMHSRATRRRQRG